MAPEGRYRLRRPAMNDFQDAKTPTLRKDNVQTVCAAVAVAALLMGGVIVKMRTGL